MQPVGDRRADGVAEHGSGARRLERRTMPTTAATTGTTVDEQRAQQPRVVEEERRADEVQRPVRVAGGEPGRVAELGKDGDLGLGRVGAGLDAVVDGVGDRGAQLLLDVGALAGRQAAQRRRRRSGR